MSSLYFKSPVKTITYKEPMRDLFATGQFIILVLVPLDNSKGERVTNVKFWHWT